MSAALSVLVWYTVQSNLGALDASHALAVLCEASLFLVLFVLGAFLFSLNEMTVIAAAFPLGFFLVAEKSGWIIAVLAFLFFLYAAMVMRSQIENRIAISFYPLASYGVPAAVTALAVLFAFMGYSYPFRISGTLSIPRGAVYVIMPFAESLIASQTPGYVPGMTVDDFLSSSAEKMLQERYGRAAAANVQMQAIVAEAVKKQRGDLSQQLGVPLNGSERAEDIITAVGDKYLNAHLVSYKEYIPFAVAISVFVAVKSIGFFMGRIIVLCAWLVMHALVALGAIERKKEQTEREVLAA